MFRVNLIAVSVLASVLTGCDPEPSTPSPAVPSASGKAPQGGPEMKAQQVNPYTYQLPPEEPPTIQPPGVDRLMSRVLFAKCYSFRNGEHYKHDYAKLGVVVPFVWNGTDAWVSPSDFPLLGDMEVRAWSRPGLNMMQMCRRGFFHSAGEGQIIPVLNYRVVAVAHIYGLGERDIALRFTETKP